jgi:hypothetical protein
MSNFKESLSQTIRKQLHERAVREYRQRMLLEKGPPYPEHMYDDPMPGQPIVDPRNPGQLYPMQGPNPGLPYHPINNPIGYQTPRPGFNQPPSPEYTPKPPPPEPEIYSDDYPYFPTSNPFGGYPYYHEPRDYPIFNPNIWPWNW